VDRAKLLAELAQKTPCPSCGQRRLEVLLRCDLQFGAYVCTAHCRACNGAFEIATGAVAPTAAMLEEAVDPCPRCGGRQRRATLHCEIEPHVCAYTLECVSCVTAQ
jgi:transcription elongation factor Elf1